MTSRRNFLKQLGFAVFSLAVGCRKTDVLSGIDVEFDLPETIDILPGGTYAFVILNGMGPLQTDSLIFVNNSGMSFTCSITEISSSSFTVQFPASCGADSYTVYIRRGSERKLCGTTYVNIIQIIDGFTLQEDSTIYGLVTTSDGPVSGALVSDGVDFAKTDANGIWQLASKKERGYVFISIPSGYEVGVNGVLPLIWRALTSDAETVERVDFNLTKKEGQDKFKLLFFGDMHLHDGKENNDMKQFTKFTDDLNSYLSGHTGETIYGMTLGDMSWDAYWYSQNFDLSNYLDTINGAVAGIQIFHTMGNHDNDWKANGDLEAELPYLKYIGPTYYSFNLGKIHIVVLDDINCDNYDGTQSYDYSCNFTAQQLEWLRKDLSYIDRSTPLIIATHAPIYYPSSSGGFGYYNASTRTDNSEEFLDIIKDYRAFILTGHTHKMHNVTPDDSITNGRNVYEHNVGAVCATWWWSDYLTEGIHICQDGTPGGYDIWDIDGTDIRHTFKGTGHDTGYQFRTYDLNNVKFSMDDVPLMNKDNGTLVEAWNKYVDAYPGSSDNEVLINIWNWNKRWTLKVVDDNGKELTPTEEWTYDPLHIAAMAAKRFNSSTITTTPSSVTLLWSHFFKVKADNASINLTVTVTDEFGNVYTEYMERPKAFSTDVYL